jgi:hypothetical protein
MKKILLNIVALLVLLVYGVELKAQNDSKISVHNICAEIGWYNPQMSYWNDIYLPDLGIPQKFESNLTYGGHVEISLPYYLRCRLGMAFWQSKVVPDPKFIFDELNIAFTDINGSLIYSFEYIELPVKPYIGVTGDFFMIANRHVVGDKIDRQYGQDYRLSPLVGVEKVIKHFMIGIEYKYHLGTYAQDVVEGDKMFSENVDVSGSQVGIKIGYKF